MVFREGRQNVFQLGHRDLLFIWAGSSSLSCFHTKKTRPQEKTNSNMRSCREICNEIQQEGSSRQNQPRCPMHKMPKTLWFQTDLCATYHSLHSLLNDTNSTCNFYLSKTLISPKNTQLSSYLKKPWNQWHKTVSTQSSPNTRLHLTTGVEQALTLAHQFPFKQGPFSWHFTVYPEAGRIY